MQTIIEIKDLVKIFKDTAQEVRAVDHVSLNITSGEFTAIVGPSGSGKLKTQKQAKKQKPKV